MNVAATNSTNATTQSATMGATASSSKTLTQNDFLKLLTVQMQNQDPMKPMDDQAFMGQMAQFSTLQATTTMSSDMTALRARSDLSTASSLVGKKVTITNTTDGTVTGNVTGVDATSGTAEIVIGNKSYLLGDITNVVPTPAPSSAASTTPTS